MDYRFEDALPVLRRTPGVLKVLLGDLPDGWTTATEGERTWSPYDVVGHLINGERTNWIPRVRHILDRGETAPFDAFDREAMFSESAGRPLGELLDTFTTVRAASLETLTSLSLTQEDLARRGRHPALGNVTLGQLLSAWVVHDLTHLSQVVRVMAHQYEDAVGPWAAYLSVLRRRVPS